MSLWLRLCRYENAIMLNVVMSSVVMLSAIVTSVGMLSDIVSSVVMLIAIMPSVIILVTTPSVFKLSVFMLIIIVLKVLLCWV
jgi:hypothetical protein